MRFSTLFVCLAVFATIVASAPRGLRAKPREVDWGAVVRNFFDLRGEFMICVQRINSIVHNENEAVGVVVETKLETASLLFDLLLGPLGDRIVAMDLLEEDAKYHVDGLREVMVNTQEELQEDISLLTPVTADRIRNVFVESFDGLDRRAQELYQLLRQ